MEEYTKGMNEYVVSLIETVDNDGINIETCYFTFECFAEDESHAHEQAENAYPHAIIIDIELIPT